MLSNRGEHIHFFILYRNIAVLLTLELWFPFWAAAVSSNGQSFVVDNTNPTRVDREKYITAAKAAGYTVVGYYFRSSIGESMERNAQRTGKARVPDVAVASIHAKLELPDYGEGFDELYYVHIGDDGFIVDEWQREGEG